MNRHAVILALLSAALFGVSTPAAKALLGAIDPSVLAGLLYCGAGVGVAILRRIAKPLLVPSAAVEAPLDRADMPWLAGAIVAGGGLSARCCSWQVFLERMQQRLRCFSTLEGVATAVLAWFVFHENFDRRVALGMACLVAGAVVLSWTGTAHLVGVHWAARHSRGLCRLGARQQPYAQGVACRPAPDRRAERSDRRSIQPGAWLVGRERACRQVHFSSSPGSLVFSAMA